MPLTLASYICIDGEINSEIDKFDLNELCGLLSITSEIGNGKLTQSQTDHTVCWIHNYQKLNTAEALNA